jgi:hypothetical protein
MAEARPRRAGPAEAEVVEFETSEDVEIIPTFDGLGLREELLRGIYSYGERQMVCLVRLVLCCVDAFRF